MPFVKPITIGRGMNFTAEPMPVKSHDNENDAGHHRAHEEAIDAVQGDDTRDDDDKSSGRAADLGRRSSEQRDQKARDDRAVDSGLGRKPGGDRECHRQWQRYEADRDSGHQVVQEFVQVVIAQAEDGLREPALVKRVRVPLETIIIASRRRGS